MYTRLLLFEKILFDMQSTHHLIKKIIKLWIKNINLLVNISFYYII